MKNVEDNSSRSLIPPVRVDFSKEDQDWITTNISKVLSNGSLTLGQYGSEFEERFADYCGCSHAIAVGSGTAALEIILRTLDVRGKDVLVPTNTFFATAAAVVHAGGRPVFLDMDPQSFAISPEEVAARITENTTGIILVHIGGIISSRVFELVELAQKRGLWLVEDAAHAHGSSIRTIHAGTFGVASAFSFYPTKVMTTCEGGMIVTNSEHIANESRLYRDQGKASASENIHIRLGYNWRLSEPHAIVGVRHLQRLSSMIASRQRIAAIYDAGLMNLSNASPLALPQDCSCNYYKYILVLKNGFDRNLLKSEFRSLGIRLAGEVYEQPLHKQPVFLEYAQGSLPLAEDYCSRHVCLPIFSTMTDEEAHRVIRACLQVIG